MASNVFEFPEKHTARRLVPSRLKEARIVRQMTQTDLAASVDVSRQAISAFEAGEKSPEPATMTRIADALGQPLAYFAASDDPTFGEVSTRFFRAFGAATKRRNAMCDVLSKWFAQVTRYLSDIVSLPPVKIPSVSPVSGDRYTDDEIEEVAQLCRKEWGLGVGPISNIVGLLENNGITICRYELTGEKIEAFSFWNGTRPFIFLSSDKQSAVRARFDAAHELGHLVLHRWICAEEIEDPKVLKLVEAEANRFAGALLLPRNSFPNEVYTPRLEAFLPLKKRWKVAVQAMIIRCRHLGIFDETQVTNLYKQISFRKWRSKEPYDDQIPSEEPKLLATAVGLIVSSGRKMKDEVASDLKIARPVIASFCGVSLDFFRVEPLPAFSPRLL